MIANLFKYLLGIRDFSQYFIIMILQKRVYDYLYFIDEKVRLGEVK